ncbi:hypothetical protein BWI17_22000 [Betaproteobacteria bacterium GR16-43]|nr:hypothetical protein BWI17_22000 [Betaproteobacteria bacterium GR16-43]
MKRVYAAANLLEAQLLLDQLAGAGIRARIFNANASSIAGELPIEASLPQLWVDEDGQHERARSVIVEFLQKRPSGPPRACPACGEENPAAFETCWSCGALL